MPKLPGYHTTADLAKATGLTQATIRYHCIKGRLAAAAQWTDTEWLIPDESARDFVASYTARRDGRSKVGRA